MGVSYCIDECEKILRLSRILPKLDCDEAGRRFTKAFWEVQYYLDDSTYNDYVSGDRFLTHLRQIPLQIV